MFVRSVVAALLLGAAGVGAIAQEGLALAIIYDTSGSMKDQVQDSAGGRSPKYQIANRALIATANQIQAYATNAPGGSPRPIEAGLFIFQGGGARPAIKWGAFDAKAFRDWARAFTSPNGNTPLGNALKTASQAVLNSSLPRKHVLVITDGINTAGPGPAEVLPALKSTAAQKQTSLGVHFIAFDIAAKVFDPIKNHGATVVSAADEAQLNSQMEYILERKILLEDEEPKK